MASSEVWFQIWYWFSIVFIAIGVVLTLVVTIGGAFDLHWLLSRLKDEVVDEADDGRVES